ncbi:hypothetical protein FGX00_00715, partial [Xylella fastidiosa subsp. multiplex]|nr:hypothetical protein [Xylella fastidiosa subsp. multiplex]
ATVRAYVTELFRRHRRAFLVLMAVNTVSVIASMAGPWLLGDLVEQPLQRGARGDESGQGGAYGLREADGGELAPHQPG